MFYRGSYGNDAAVSGSRQGPGAVGLLPCWASRSVACSCCDSDVSLGCEDLAVSNLQAKTVVRRLAVASLFATLGVSLVVLVSFLVGTTRDEGVVVAGDDRANLASEGMSVEIEDLLDGSSLSEIELGPFVSMRSAHFGVVRTDGPLAPQAGDVAVTLRIQQFVDSGGESLFHIESQGWFESENISGSVIAERCRSFDFGELRVEPSDSAISFQAEFSDEVANYFPQRLAACSIPGAGRQLRAALTRPFDIASTGKVDEFVLFAGLDGEEVVIQSIEDPTTFASKQQ